MAPLFVCYMCNGEKKLFDVPKQTFDICTICDGSGKTEIDPDVDETLDMVKDSAR